MKRIFDIFFSSIAIILFSPILIVISLFVFCAFGRPVIFRQSRVGFQSRVFYIYKFRTMTNQRDESGCLLPDSMRLTRFGAFLRSTSLDELPELWNVLRGDMSLVGPRPLLVEYLPLYNSTQARRHDVRPGLTGFAQINGRNSLSWNHRFALDVWYVDNQSFPLDLCILFLTFWKVITREGINASPDITMSPFTGSSPD